MGFGIRVPVLLAFLAVAPVPMIAQVIRGRVVDRTQGGPIPNVTVSLADSAGVVVASMVTTPDGVFEVKGRGGGRYRLGFKRIGYRESEFLLEVGAGDLVQVPPEVSSLQAAAVALEEARVTGIRHRRLERVGFYQRRLEGHGSFITRDEFLVTKPSETTDVLRRLRGIRVKPNGNFGVQEHGESDARRFIIETSRGGGSMSGRGNCPTQFFVDGILVGNAADTKLDLDMTIRVEDIEAIEVYSGAGQLPAAFNIMGGLCGAIVIWTQ